MSCEAESSAGISRSEDHRAPGTTSREWRISNLLDGSEIPHSGIPLPVDTESIFQGRTKRFGGKSTVRQTAALTIGLGTMIALLIAVFALRSGIGGAEDLYSSPWHYKCDGGLCQKELITKEVTIPISLEVCQLFCGASSSLWPKPTGHLSLSTSVVQLDPEKISLDTGGIGARVKTILEQNVFLLQQNARNSGGRFARNGGLSMIIRFVDILDTGNVRLTLDTDESYTLHIKQENNELNTTITAKTYFGARHALETLTQLIVFDDLRNQIQIPSEVFIEDGPVYPYRGILLDTSRNFVDKATILRTIEAMGMSKLNTFHWHITDSHSFPYVSRTWPQFSRFGAYSPDKVYTQEDVREIVDYGLLHGVRVLPEFDAPAHVGEGWQWVGDNATVCFKAEPWKSYCVEPPCGQLNPTSEKVYEVLEGIYKDMIQDFQPDIFHMGGDEVNINCWQSSEMIKDWMQKTKGWNLTESSFYLLWDYFQERALDKLTAANGGRQIPAILWTSGLTSEENIKHLDPRKYIIQIWTTGTDATIARLLKNNFNVIFSNYDALYLDCGFGAWVGEGNNWCSPYKGWQAVYGNSPLSIIKMQGFESKKHLVQGGEAALWSEQVDSTTIDSRIWPRAAALAERLWAEPTSSWVHAEQRILRHRERLVKRGILAESLEPEWCLQNQGYCYA